MGICQNVSSGALAIAKIGDFLEWFKNTLQKYWIYLVIGILSIVALIILR